MCDSHVTDHKTFPIFSNIQGAFTHDLKITLFDWLISGAYAAYWSTDSGQYTVIKIVVQ